MHSTASTTEPLPQVTSELCVGEHDASSSSNLRLRLVMGQENAGLILGPLIGGLLAQRAQPPAYPFLLPNVFGCLLALLFSLPLSCFIPETRHHDSVKFSRLKGEEEVKLELVETHTESKAMDAEGNFREENEEEDEDEEEATRLDSPLKPRRQVQPPKQPSPSGRRRSKGAQRGLDLLLRRQHCEAPPPASASKDEGKEEDADEEEMEEIEVELGYFGNGLRQQEERILPSHDSRRGPSHREALRAIWGGRLSQPHRGRCPELRRPVVLGTMAAYTIFSWVAVMFDEASDRC